MFVATIVHVPDWFVYGGRNTYRVPLSTSPSMVEYTVVAGGCCATTLVTARPGELTTASKCSRNPHWLLWKNGLCPMLSVNARALVTEMAACAPFAAHKNTSGSTKPAGRIANRVRCTW